jgi:NitT/TauT family transport system substrate-binding protein
MTIVLAGCRGATTESNSLRIAVLPILDSLPLYVADAEGYFSAEGVSVEMVPVASSSERDQLLQAEQIDGVITDLVALALYNRESPQVLGLRFAMVPTEDDAQFRLLTAADTGFKNVEDLSGVPIGISKGTIIEYVTQGLLTREGLPPEAIHTLAVPKIPERMALLNSGDLAAATLPEPLAALAIQKGATVVIDDRRHPKLSGSLYAFRAEVVESKPDAMTAFFAAIEQATEAINEDALHWEPLLREQRVIPPTLEGELVLPTYPGAAIPDAGQFRDVVAWLQASGRLESAPAYADVITDRYLTE